MQQTAKLLTKSALGFGLVLGLTACSLIPNQPVAPIEISTKPVQKPQLTLPPVDELNLREVEWTILTEENIDEEIARLKEIGAPVSFFALNGDGYENLGLNFSDIRALVQQQRAIIAAYENYYQQSEELLDQAVIVE